MIKSQEKREAALEAASRELADVWAMQVKTGAEKSLDTTQPCALQWLKNPRLFRQLYRGKDNEMPAWYVAVLEVARKHRLIK